MLKSMQLRGKLCAVLIVAFLCHFRRFVPNFDLFSNIDTRLKISMPKLVSVQSLVPISLLHIFRLDPEIGTQCLRMLGPDFIRRAGSVDGLAWQTS